MWPQNEIEGAHHEAACLESVLRVPRQLFWARPIVASFLLCACASYISWNQRRLSDHELNGCTLKQERQCTASTTIVTADQKLDHGQCESAAQELQKLAGSKSLKQGSALNRIERRREGSKFRLSGFKWNGEPDWRYIATRHSHNFGFRTVSCDSLGASDLISDLEHKGLFWRLNDASTPSCWLEIPGGLSPTEISNPHTSTHKINVIFYWKSSSRKLRKSDMSAISLRKLVEIASYTLQFRTQNYCASHHYRPNRPTRNEIRAHHWICTQQTQTWSPYRIQKQWQGGVRSCTFLCLSVVITLLNARVHQRVVLVARSRK